MLQERNAGIPRRTQGEGNSKRAGTNRAFGANQVTGCWKLGWGGVILVSVIEHAAVIFQRHLPQWPGHTLSAGQSGGLINSNLRSYQNKSIKSAHLCTYEKSTNSDLKKQPNKLFKCLWRNILNNLIKTRDSVDVVIFCIQSHFLSDLLIYASESCVSDSVTTSQTRLRGSLPVRLSFPMGETHDLSNSQRVMIVSARRAGSSISETAALLGFPLNAVSMEDSVINKKDSASVLWVKTPS